MLERSRYLVFVIRLYNTLFKYPKLEFTMCKLEISIHKNNEWCNLIISQSEFCIKRFSSYYVKNRNQKTGTKI